jgi:SAM-dependent methyltransferase
MNTTKTSLVPDEDQGVVFVNVSTAAGSSLKTTNDVMMRIEKRMMDIPQVLHVQRVAGYGLLAGQGNSFGMLILKLKPWDEREGKENDVQAVIGQVYGRTADIKDASIFAISPGMIPGYGMGNASVLEIGAGCGAISGVLCRNAKHVTSVDLSKRRSLINANRNKEYDNLTIMVGNFNDVVLKEKYDYITLIGVLEYAGYYTDDEHPFEAFLKKISGYLKEDGKLLIAIENKFGLKYWAGSREDHTGKFFDGLEGYIDTDSKVRTFSKEALKKIITDAGYGKAEFYYPFPDYKFPVQIFSDEYLPREDDLNIGLDTFDNTRMMLFNENRVYANLLKEKKFEFFANSFFIEVTK